MNIRFHPRRAPRSPRPLWLALPLCVLWLGLSATQHAAHAAPTFATKTDYSTGNAPYGVTSADFNGDGKLDLAVANANDNSVSVLLGNGNGAFGAKTDYPVGNTPYAVTSADFNGDGKADLAVVNSNANTLSVLFGNGNGTFAAKTDYGAGNTPFSVTSADFNGDGKADLATDSGISSVSVLLGTGNGAFGAKVDYGAGINTYSVTSGDFNGDGKADLVVSNASRNTVTVLRGNGDGTFIVRNDYMTGTAPIAVTIGDFNGDGKPDLAVANSNSNSVSVLLGNADGIFAAKTDYATGALPRSVTSGDFNGDGKADLVVANTNGNSASVLLGNGDGTFAAKTDYATGASPYSVTSGDFNGDGKADLAIANTNSNTISVLLNATAFPPTIASFTPTRGPIGSTVKITGANLTGATAVSFGGTAASSFTVDSDTQITATVATGTATGKIAVTTPLGTVTSANDFTVTEAPQSGPNFVVNQTDDHDDGTCGPTDCTLREAINAASGNGLPNNVITFDATVFASKQTIALTNGLLPLINTDITITGPTASGAGVTVDAGGNSGIFGVIGGTSTFSNLTLSGGNNNGGNGGAIEQGGASTLTLNNCTIAGNTSSGIGGAIFTNAQLTLNSCTLSGNTANFSGGAIFNSGTLTLKSCTLSGNTGANGGGIYSVNTLTLNSCTLSGNSAGNSAGNGGGIFIGRGTLNSSNTIVAGNTATTNPDLSGTINAGDYNLIGNSQGAIFSGSASHNLTNVDPKLGPLKDNGGPTATFALLAGSPAINAGDPNFDGTGQFDERGPGFPRVRRGRLDIGAFEVQNSAPTVTGFPKTLDEDGTLTFAISDFSGAFSDPDAGDTLQSVRIETLPTNGTLNFNGVAATAGQTVAVADLGKLTFTPDANFNGVTSFAFNGSDAYGFAANFATVSLTINAVNDAPSFTVGPNQNVNEDAGTQSVAKFITNISAGAANESAQKLNFIVSNDNNALFATPPAIDDTGTLTYALAANANGVAAVSVKLHDDGGTTNSGADTSAGQNFTITINAVNDAPSFALGGDQTVAEASGAQSVANFATNINAGAPDESAQTLTFIATNDNNALFSVQPAIGADGTLTYTLAPKAAGTANVSVVLQDDGGTSNGGKDTSAAQSFVITVTANPILFGVSIVPKAPLTRDTLTATPVIADDEGVTFTYNWQVNGKSVQNGASRFFDLSQPGQGDKGDVVSVVVTATNTRGGAGSTTNQVKVFDSAPFAFSGTATAKSGVETVIAFRLFGNPGGADSDGDALTYKRVGGPRNGVAAFKTDANGSNVLRYTSRSGFVGVEVIRFVAVEDSGRTSNVATLAIDVKGQPIVAPTAKDASAIATAGVRVDVPVTGADSNGGAVTFKRVGGPRNGVGEFVTLQDGTTVLRYTARSNFVGVEEVRFVALNADGRPSNVATIRITVSASGASNSGASALQTGDAPSAAHS